MATWPESNPTPRYSLIVEPEFETLISNFDGGGEQRRQKLMYPRYNVNLKYDSISASEANTLWEFYMARNGAYEAFYIYDLSLLIPNSFVHNNQYCGIGNDITTIFDIPGRSTSAHTVYIGTIDETLNATFLTGGGVSSSDRVSFPSAVTLGKIVTINFTGYLRIRVRFLEDKLPRESFIANLYNYGIKLKGLSVA